MTHLTHAASQAADTAGYRPDQALARDLLITAVNGSISHWARVHGVLTDCPPSDARAEGIDIKDRRLWHVDLTDLHRTITKLIDAPGDCADPSAGLAPGLLSTISHTLADARNRGLTRMADLEPGPDLPPIWDRVAFEQMVADVVFQLAVAEEVVY